MRLRTAPRPTSLPAPVSAGQSLLLPISRGVAPMFCSGKGWPIWGGMHVILTEFHESARIDRQLYGRTGRQGAPGSTEAMVSLEDELFTRFAPWLLWLCRLLPRPQCSRCCLCAHSAESRQNMSAPGANRPRWTESSNALSRLPGRRNRQYSAVIGVSLMM